MVPDIQRLTETQRDMTHIFKLERFGIFVDWLFHANWFS
jgi:hypothetical protein